MKKNTQLLTALSAALISFLTSVSSYAAIQTWVASTGSGNTCSLAAPCNSLRIAYDATDQGGVINLLDSGNFGVVQISRSITLRAVGVDAGATINDQGDESSTWITVSAGAADVVTLEGLHLNGDGGVDFLSGKQLNVIKCVITNASGDVMNAGIRFEPTSVSKLSVTDTVITNMGSGTGGGIIVNPQGSGGAQVALERVTINGNAFGIAADGSSSTGGINMTIADSMIANNARDGIIATTSSGGAPIGVYVKDTKSVNNAFGIRSAGTNVTVRVDGSSVIGNVTGLSFSGGGVLATYGNNAVNANAANGAFSGSIPLQ